MQRYGDNSSKTKNLAFLNLVCCVRVFNKRQIPSKEGCLCRKGGLSPELFLARSLHLALTFRAGMLVPHPDMIAAAVQAEPPYLTPVRRGHIGDDTPHHDVLDRLAIGARHGCDLLAEEPTTFVHLGLIATGCAAIFQFPGHYQTYVNFECKYTHY